MKTQVGYHFLNLDMTAGQGSEPAWTVGEKRTLHGGTINPCQYGYHQSPTLFDALKYAPGSMACRTELSGRRIVAHGSPVDKYAGRTRRLIAAIDVSHALRHFAADCAEHILPRFEEKYPNDARPRAAIQAARDFADGKIASAASAAALSAASAAALSATAGAAYYAASAASAAARSATAYAAYYAASAASAAALSAALAAASAAASYYAARGGGAARAMEIEWQRDRFDAQFGGIFDA
jgi:hypothetical protein